MRDRSPPPKIGAPYEAFNRLIEYVLEIDKLLELSIMAIGGLSGYTELISTLVEVDRSKQYPPDEVAKARALEAAAEEEHRNGYQLLIAHSIVGLWSALDTAIPRFCVDWLLMHPDTLGEQPFNRMKVSPSLLVASDRPAVMEDVVDELMRSTGSRLKEGIGRYEVLLEAIGVNVMVNDELRRDLFELSKVRNVIVHQSGRADRKFVERCPWFGAAANERIRLSEDHYHRYSAALWRYTAAILRAKTGKDARAKAGDAGDDNGRGTEGTAPD